MVFQVWLWLGCLLLQTTCGYILPTHIQNALHVLEEYDRSYLARMTEGRRLGLTPGQVEFKRVQSLKKEGVLKERHELKQSLEVVASEADKVILGIMADSGIRGVEVLRAWTIGLGVKKNILYAVDHVSNNNIEIRSLDDSSVYIKYDSNKNDGDAYMKLYEGEYNGVIFQPLFPDEEFRQYGNLPSSIFN